jgi:phosphoribosyl 1,2-cyclic phosphodiesterase
MMSDQVVYRQLNKDYAYWTEKRRLGQQRGGHVAGLLTHLEGGKVRQNVLFDAGLGTLEAIADFCDDAFWDQPLVVFITHGHIDHHAELMILSEIYCTRRGAHIHDYRPPLAVYCTAETHKYLLNVHRYRYEIADTKTLQHRPVVPDVPVELDIFSITPLAVDHFEGAVIYVIEFGRDTRHKIVIGWDMTTLPAAPHHIERLSNPNLALIEATTWTPMAADIGHTSVEDLVTTGFLDRLRLQYEPESEKYGAYLVHYSGWEDPWGMLTDEQLKERFDHCFPTLSDVVRVAERGQRWQFSL